MNFEVKISQKNKYGTFDDIIGELDHFDDVQVLINFVMLAFPESKIVVTIAESNIKNKEDK